MKQSLKHYITLNNRKYWYTLKAVDKKTTFVECDAANIRQAFLNADIPPLLNDLPDLIISEKIFIKQQNEIIRFRISAEDKRRIEKKALQKGYTSVSSFLRDLALKGA
jgi:hypothetical protein